MAIYNVSNLLQKILNEINAITGIKTPYILSDADAAYEEAVRECGFSCPTSSDADKEKKYHWLLQRMRRYFMWQLLQKFILQFKSGDADAQGMVKNLERIIDKLDAAFEKAKEELAGLFADVSEFGTGLVQGTGLIDDRVGESTEDRTTGPWFKE